MLLLAATSGGRGVASSCSTFARMSPRRISFLRNSLISSRSLTSLFVTHTKQIINTDILQYFDDERKPTNNTSQKCHAPLISCHSNEACPATPGVPSVTTIQTIPSPTGEGMEEVVVEGGRGREEVEGGGGGGGGGSRRV